VDDGEAAQARCCERRRRSINDTAPRDHFISAAAAALDDERELRVAPARELQRRKNCARRKLSDPQPLR
jgi:hypothetical protein